MYYIIILYLYYDYTFVILQITMLEITFLK